MAKLIVDINANIILPAEDCVLLDTTDLDCDAADDKAVIDCAHKYGVQVI